jgi:hypothetical protein
MPLWALSVTRRGGLSMSGRVSLSPTGRRSRSTLGPALPRRWRSSPSLPGVSSRSPGSWRDRTLKGFLPAGPVCATVFRAHVGQLPPLASGRLAWGDGVWGTAEAGKVLGNRHFVPVSMDSRSLRMLIRWRRLCASFPAFVPRRLGRLARGLGRGSTPRRLSPPFGAAAGIPAAALVTTVSATPILGRMSILAVVFLHFCLTLSFLVHAALRLDPARKGPM